MKKIFLFLLMVLPVVSSSGQSKKNEISKNKITIKTESTGISKNIYSEKSPQTFTSSTLTIEKDDHHFVLGNFGSYKKLTATFPSTKYESLKKILETEFEFKNLTKGEDNLIAEKTLGKEFIKINLSHRSLFVEMENSKSSRFPVLFNQLSDQIKNVLF